MSKKKKPAQGPVAALEYDEQKKRWTGEGMKGRTKKDPATITEALERGHKTFGVRVDVRPGSSPDEIERAVADYLRAAVKTLQKTAMKRGHRARIFITAVDLDDSDETRAALEKACSRIREAAEGEAAEDAEAPAWDDERRVL